MVSANFTEGTSSSSTPQFKEVWMPGQKSYVSKFLAPLKQIFSGNLTNPQAIIMGSLAREGAEKEAATQRRVIGSTRGISEPARGKALAGLSKKAVEAAGTVPQTIWQSAMAILKEYALASPTVAGGSVGKSEGGGGVGGGVGCECTNLRAVGDGGLDENLRRFRDLHFSPVSYLEKGYKAMAVWFVPLIQKHSGAKKLGRLLMLLPLCKIANWCYGRDKLGFTLLPFAYFWIYFWKAYGRVSLRSFGEKTPRALQACYPSMSRTFLSCFRGRGLKES